MLTPPFKKSYLFISLAALSIVILGSTLLPTSTQAQNYPTKPVRIVVNYPAGGPSDAIARPLAHRVTEIWSQQVVIDFKGGAAGNIGADHVAKSAPDGYTFLLFSSSFLTNAAMGVTLPFDPINDFTPITPVASNGIIMVGHPSLPVKGIQDLIRIAKKQPGKLTFGSSGSGGSLHLSAELFKMLAGVDILHVPYKGASPSLIDVVGGQVDMMFIAIPPTLGHIKNGRLKALGMGGLKRSPVLPELPTIAEQGLKGYEVSSHYGILAPPGLSRDLTQKMNQVFTTALQGDYVKEHFAQFGSESIFGPSDTYTQFIKAEIEKWKLVVKKARIRNN